MNDFIYSARPLQQGCLTNLLRSIYRTSVPECVEFHGYWGSLAASRGHYRGFAPIEDDRFICIVIGGPVLLFRDNDHLAGTDEAAASRSILQRWRAGGMNWSEDLSGPFVVLLIDKSSAKIFCVTDLMMFVPVYQGEGRNGFVLGTHVDLVAEHCGQRAHIDEVSLADFVLHDVVTYPYTAYEQVRQCHPAAVHRYLVRTDGTLQVFEPEVYWWPTERNPYANLDEAANALREGLSAYVGRITAHTPRVAQFISAGEDSRALSGLLPSHVRRDGLIFLDSMNREGRIARQVAKAYGVNFNVVFRGPTHYLDILPEASDLVGLGHQYVHAHSLGFHLSCNLQDYAAVFGGYLSDSLLKSAYAKRAKGTERFPFLPEVSLPGEERSAPVRCGAFPEAVLKEMTGRRREHLERVQHFRSSTAHEWFVLWPMTMRAAIPNFYTTRRLFASYEPYMCSEVVKVAAAVPTSWKLNRRLFNRAMRPMLRTSKSIPHADGRLPYYPWWVNAPRQFPIWVGREIWRRLLSVGGNEGPWGDWQKMSKSPVWREYVAQSRKATARADVLRYVLDKGHAFAPGSLSILQQVNLLQVCYSVGRQEQRRKTSKSRGDIIA